MARWLVLTLLILMGLAVFGPGRDLLQVKQAELAIASDAGSVALSEAREGSAKSRPQEARKLRKPVAVTLDEQQALLALHISGQYRRALDVSRELVHHAYQVAREAQIDPLLVLAIVAVESKFNPLAESPAGAQGLMQVLTRVHFAKFQPFGGVQAAFDPAANLKVGTAILRHYLQAYDTLPLALKAYVGAAQAEHDFGYSAKVLAMRDHLGRVATGTAGAISSDQPRMVQVIGAAGSAESQGSTVSAQDDI